MLILGHRPGMGRVVYRTQVAHMCRYGRGEGGSSLIARRPNVRHDGNMDTELHGLDWCSVHHRKIPGVKQRADNPCPYCGNPLPLRSQPYRVGVDGLQAVADAVAARTFRQVQVEYERVRAERPDLSHEELWHQAEQAAGSTDGPSDEALSRQVEQWVRDEVAHLRRSDPNARGRDLRRRAERTVERQIAAEVKAGEVVPRRSRTGFLGFVLVCLATPMAVTSLVLIYQGGRSTDYAFWLWAAASLIGSVALGFLVAANGRIRHSLGLVTGQGLVGAGLALATIGAAASFFVMLFGAMMSYGI